MSAKHLSGPRIHLHLNGIALVGVAVIGYSMTGLHWWLFAVLFFVPDIFMLGYVVNPSIGAFIYNIGHSLLIPAILFAVSFLQIIGGISSAQQIGFGLSAVWTAHIGMDWMLGYGYKYPTKFSDTDIGRA